MPGTVHSHQRHILTMIHNLTLICHNKIFQQFHAIYMLLNYLIYSPTLKCQHFHIGLFPIHWIWASPCEKGSYHTDEHRRLRQACTSAQSHQSLLCLLTQYSEPEEVSDKEHQIWPHSGYWVAVHAHLKDHKTHDAKVPSNSYELPHDKTNKMTCAPSEDSDQPGHPPSLISLRCSHEESLAPWLPTECTAKSLSRLGGCTGGMPRLIWVFAVRM